MLDSFLATAGLDLPRHPSERWRRAAILGLCLAADPDGPARSRLAAALHALDWPTAVTRIVAPDDPDAWSRWWAVLAAGQTGRLDALDAALARARAAERHGPDAREVARRLADLSAEMAALAGEPGGEDARFAVLGNRVRPDRRVLVGGRSSAAYLVEPGWHALRLVRLGPSDGPAAGNAVKRPLAELMELVRRGDGGGGRAVPGDLPAPPEAAEVLEALREGAGERDRRLLSLAGEVREERERLAAERATLQREREELLLERTRLRRSGANGSATRRAAPTAAPEVPRTAAEAERVLGVSASAGPEAVERAYRRLVAGVHPDRVAELDPRIRARAEELTVALNSARDLLLGRAAPARAGRARG